MSLSFLATLLLVPPPNLPLLGLLGLLLPWRRVGRAVAAIALLGLLMLALPFTGKLIYVSLERNLQGPAQPAPQAIIVLGGDVSQTGGADPHTEIGALTLERLRAGAALARRTGLPLLVTGGVLDLDGPPVAELMARSLAEDFSVPAKWVEPRAGDTWGNARLSEAMLAPAGIRSVYVVTHAWHMRRALLAFRGTGLAVTPAPTQIDQPPGWDATEFVPRISAWTRAYYGLHEWIGIAWYSLRG